MENKNAYRKMQSETILAQMGGRRLLLMTGAEANIGQDKDGRAELTLALRSIRKAFRVTLRNDLYDIEFFRVSRTGEKIILNSVEGVYADNLVEIFERWSGLRASL